MIKQTTGICANAHNIDTLWETNLEVVEICHLQFTMVYLSNMVISRAQPGWFNVSFPDTRDVGAPTWRQVSLANFMAPRNGFARTMNFKAWEDEPKMNKHGLLDRWKWLVNRLIMAQEDSDWLNSNNGRRGLVLIGKLKQQFCQEAIFATPILCWIQRPRLGYQLCVRCGVINRDGHPIG